LAKGEKSMLGKGHKSVGSLIITLLTCAIIGSYIGDIFQPYMPKILAAGFTIGTGPFPINLKVINVTFGLTLSMNFMSIIGLIIALIIYFKL
jgi:hypothetical protein